MEWTSLNQLREMYLSFFESKGHLRLNSFPLIPNNDKSLLLINSGMAPMKKFFTGDVTPPAKRVTTCQKCIRTPDIERVGKTARHGTYFEMLGNFSFGDYFKEQATAWAWEFCTKVVKLPVDRIWVSIYENDDEAFDIWTKKVGVDPSHIVRLGKEDNFWEHGTGPCGPCSELYFDRGVEHGCGSPDCGVGCECDRFVEFWNLVFTQFDSDGKGNYAPLEHPNIDTGMGLERLACIMQGVDNLFEVDTVANIMKHLCKICGVEYKQDATKDVSIRVITDHIRSTTFMLGDGVKPSNEGRGYVLRRLLRRAARHGRLLGINKPFLSELCDTVIAENLTAYPELNEKKDFIKKVISVEEENFAKTIDQGLELLENLTKEGGVLSGEDAFRLYDTYGFPLDLTKDILQEKGMTVDEESFDRLMNEQKTRSRDSRKKDDFNAWKDAGDLFADFDATEFVGYTNTVADTKIIAMFANGEQVDTANDGEQVAVLLQKTPFYATSGGQVGDTGIIEADGFSIAVDKTEKNAAGVIAHYGKVIGNATLTQVCAKVDEGVRNSIRRNHTAAHLLQGALRKVLGTHVEQAGQLVNDKTVRFDFTHFSAVTAEELAAIEAEVNRAVLDAIAVENTEMPIEQAKQKGAMALFGEKYSDVVRVVDVPGYSIELCGGTHVSNTAQIGLFRIISESSVASGVRRIEAVTGENTGKLLDKYKATIDSVAAALKANKPEDIENRIKQLQAELKECQQKLEKIEAQNAGAKVQQMVNGAVDCNGLKLVCAKVEAASDALRSMCDEIKAWDENAVAVLASVYDGKLTFCVACGAGAVAKGAHAGNLVRNVAAVAGGKGGGKPDSAMAGGKDIDKADDALAAAKDLLLQMIGE